jgi:hypothetical protein
VLGVARRAGRREALIGVVNRAIVAGEARLVTRPRRESWPAEVVAGAALLIEHGMSWSQRTAAVYMFVVCQTVSGEPDDS